MERRLARFGAECRTASPETVEAQRQLVARLEAGELPEARQSHATARRLERGAEAITWLAEPVTIPGGTIKLLGWDEALTGRPPWLPAGAVTL